MTSIKAFLFLFTLCISYTFSTTSSCDSDNMDIITCNRASSNCQSNNISQSYHNKTYTYNYDVSEDNIGPILTNISYSISTLVRAVNPDDTLGASVNILILAATALAAGISLWVSVIKPYFDHRKYLKTLEDTLGTDTDDPQNDAQFYKLCRSRQWRNNYTRYYIFDAEQPILFSANKRTLLRPKIYSTKVCML